MAAIKRHDQGIFVDKLAIAESLGYTSSKAAGTAAAQYQQDLDQKGPSEILRRVEGKNIKIRASNKKKKKRDREELLKPGDYMLPSFYESKAFEDDLALPITDRKYVEYDQLRAPTSRHRMTGINKMLRASGEGKQLQSALIAADFAQLGLGEKPAYHTSDKEAMAEAQTAVLRQMAGEGYDRAEMEAVQKQFEGMSSIQMLNKANSVFQDKDRTPVAKIDDEKYEEELDEDGRKIRKKGEDGKPLPFDRYETYTTQEDENRTTSVGFKNTKHVIDNLDSSLETSLNNSDSLEIILILILLSVILGSILLGYAFLQKTNVTNPQLLVESNLPSISIEQKTKDMLNLSINLFENNSHKDAFEKLGQTIRFYYCNKLNLNVEMTSFEIISELKQSKINDFENIIKWLLLCGSVEFTKHQSHKTEFDNIVSSFLKQIS